MVIAQDKLMTFYYFYFQTPINALFHHSAVHDNPHTPLRAGW